MLSMMDFYKKHESDICNYDTSRRDIIMVKRYGEEQGGELQAKAQSHGGSIR